MKNYNLTQPQLGVFYSEQNNMANTSYNLCFLNHLDKDIDLERLAKAIEKTVEAHPILQSRIVMNQDCEPTLEDCSTEKYIQTIEAAASYEEVKNSLLFTDDFGRVRIKLFNLQTENLFRFRIFQTPQGNYFFQDIHHIICDGVSRIILQEDIDKAYRGIALEKEAYTAFDIANEDTLFRESEIYLQECAWYEENFKGLETSSLPVAYGGTSNDRGFLKFSKKLTIDPSVVYTAKDKYKVSPSAIFNAAFAFFLGEINNKNEAGFSTISSGRPKGKNLGKTIGMMTQTLPVFLNYNEIKLVKELVEQAYQQTLETRDRTNIGYLDIFKTTNWKSEIMFAYHGKITSPSFILDRRNQHREDLREQRPGFTLTVEVYQEADHYLISCAYPTDLYGMKFIGALIDSFDTILAQFCEKELLSDVSIIGDDTSNEILQLSKGKDLDVDMSRTFSQLVSLHAKNDSRLLAVVDENSSYTYSELNRAANIVAHQLVALSIKPNSFVGIMLDRQKEFPMSVVATHKAGAAYVPFDYEYPADRIQYMIEDSKTEVVITTRQLWEEKQKEGKLSVKNTLFLDDINWLEESEELDLSACDNLAYMIYTSGSTGKPKGVMIPHSNILYYVAWRVEVLKVKKSNNYAHHPSFSFDASLDDILTPLVAGACIHIMSSSLRQDLVGMSEYFAKHKIVGLTISSQIGTQLVNNCSVDGLQYIMMGGDKMNPMLKVKPSIINGYGPTEFTVCSSYHIVDQERDVNIPIGRAVPNSYSVIVDKNGHLLPHGMVGELCLIGAQISLGYWEREELTAERFVECKFLPGQKMYRTGDLSRYNNDNCLEYFGRIDFQVKLRGFRIEMGEIEGCIASFPNIGAVVAEVKVIGSSQRLCAYYTAKDRNVIDKEELKAHLSKHLTEYMVPDVYIQMETMPLTPNGKINRKALPTPGLNVCEEIVLAETKREKTLLTIASQILNRTDFGITHDLDQLGMSSLDFIRFAALAEKEGIKVKVNDMIRLKTIEAISKHLMLMSFWINEYTPEKPVLVIPYGIITPMTLLDPFVNELKKYFSIYAFEPVVDHYKYVFKGDNTDDVAAMYISLLQFHLPENAQIFGFFGYSFGGEIAYRMAVEWEKLTGVRVNLYMLDTLIQTKTKEQNKKEFLVSINSLSNDLKEAILAHMSILNVSWDLSDLLEISKYDGSVLLFNATINSNVIEKIKQWKKHTSHLRVVDIEAIHAELHFEKHIPIYVEHITNDLKGYEKNKLSN